MKRRSRRWLIALALVCGGAVRGAGDEATFRYQAPIAVEKPGAFVLVPLSAAVYAHSLQVGLNDLRVVDARGDRVPFALLSPRGGQVTTTDQVREAAIYPLPPRPAADGTWAAPIELEFSAGPKPPDAKDEADGETRALYFDLGGALPIAQIELRWADGTHVAPVRIDGQTRAGDRWWPLGAGVFYRLDRGGVISTSGPLAVSATARYVRVTPDARAGTLDPARTRLVVWAQFASLLFAAQGQAPYSLLAGSVIAPSGSLPAATLVPSLDDERPRFGRAALGPWSEVAAVAREAEAARRRTLIRLGLLWTVLLGGVAGLAFMVWRLARPATIARQ
jgi:Protein of unknown function (DUF3999)